MRRNPVDPLAKLSPNLAAVLLKIHCCRHATGFDSRDDPAFYRDSKTGETLVRKLGAAGLARVEQQSDQEVVGRILVFRGFRIKAWPVHPLSAAQLAGLAALAAPSRYHQRQQSGGDVLTFNR